MKIYEKFQLKTLQFHSTIPNQPLLVFPIFYAWKAENLNDD